MHQKALCLFVCVVKKHYKCIIVKFFKKCYRCVLHRDCYQKLLKSQFGHLNWMRWKWQNDSQSVPNVHFVNRLNIYECATGSMTHFGIIPVRRCLVQLDFNLISANERCDLLLTYSQQLDGRLKNKVVACLFQENRNHFFIISRDIFGIWWSFQETATHPQ